MPCCPASSAITPKVSGPGLCSSGSSAIDDRIADDLELGRHDEAVADLSAMVAGEPLRERPRELLMLAFYKSGRQAEALETFRAARACCPTNPASNPAQGFSRCHLQPHRLLYPDRRRA